MNEQTLSRRLERVAAQVPQGARLADIGSDHGYLPIALKLRGVIDSAVAGEVALTPYLSAQRKVRKNALQAVIDVRHGSGLTVLQASDRISVVTMCGMGGETIRDILIEGQQHLRGNELLVLQPNVREWVARGWLAEHGYQIIHEEMLEENAFTYEVIVARRAQGPRYTPEQCYFGPLLMAERSALFLAKWRLNLQRKQRVMAHWPKAKDVPSSKREEIGQQVRWITEMLG
ncbi:tRNA (adenine(22)-N(1))-methyltransferase [Pseudomonas sp.]|uniref:tRNA (adenine(22)-N(1))-methyltransferase n=1 Tax=Pseudomonas sp. TaxID=306 RepID=UPI0028AA535E|nr:tRNA (adenine(22)-N(1))-methyltransferase TrmK [Pseudomonas sp.]